MGDASAVPIRASAAVSPIIKTSVGGVGIAVVDEAGTYMGRIIAAAVVVGIIVVAIARSYRHVRPWDAATIFDLDHIVARGLCRGSEGTARPMRHWPLAQCRGRPTASKQASRMDANKFRLLMRLPRSFPVLNRNHHPRSVKTSSGAPCGRRSCLRRPR